LILQENVWKEESIEYTEDTETEDKKEKDNEKNNKKTPKSWKEWVSFTFIPFLTLVMQCSHDTVELRGVLGNKCAGQHKLKKVHFREELASGNFLAWLSGVCVFFYSSLSTLGRQRRAFM
jgi:hypothetical protein